MTDAIPDYAPLCAAPDRNPRGPRAPFPPLACDTHAHIFGPAARFPYVKERIYTPPDSTYDDYRKLLAALGVQRAVLVQPSVYGEDNTAMLDAMQRFGPGVRAVADCADLADRTQAEIKALHDAGVRGLRFNVVDRPREQERRAGRHAARRGQTDRPFGWHIELLVNVDEAPEFARAVAGHSGADRARPSRLSEIRRAALDATSGLRRPARLLDGGRCWIKLTGPYRSPARRRAL